MSCLIWVYTVCKFSYISFFDASSVKGILLSVIVGDGACLAGGRTPDRDGSAADRPGED